MTPRPIIPLPLILAVCLGLVLMLPGSRMAAAEGPPLVVAFYYAWYDANTWGSGLPADQPREAYASSDPAAIGRHVAQAQAAGIDALIQSWYGPQEANNQTETNFRMLLDAAAARGSYAAVDFETTGPFFPGRASVVEALRYLMSTHAKHPAYLHYMGRPVIFFWRQQRFSTDEWVAIRQEVDPDHNSLWIAEGVDIGYQAVFDGHHLYSIAWSANAGRTLDDWGSRVRRYEAQHGVDRLWVATAMPGYDDTRTSRGDKFAVNRRNGDYYRETWAAATASQPDWIVITSFNEWVEGTMIEPSVTYGDLYLDLTRELAAAYKSGQVAPQPIGQVLEAASRVEQATSQESDTRDRQKVSNRLQTPPYIRVEQATSQDSDIRDRQKVSNRLQTPPYIRAEEAVRVRAGPGTGYAQVGSLYRGDTAPVVGKSADASWWQIEYVGTEEGQGWVTTEFVTFVGNPDTVPVVEEIDAIPGPTPTPAATAGPSPVSSPTQTIRPSPTSLPTPTARQSPAALPSPSPDSMASATASPTSRATQEPASTSPASPTSAFTPTSNPSPMPTSTMTTVGSRTASPAPTNSPTVRTIPAVPRRPVGLLWIGITALVLAVGLGVLLIFTIRRKR